MSVYLFSLLIFITSCASPVKLRKPASMPTKIQIPAEMDHKKSMVQIFPAVAADNGIWYFFYLRLKDAKGNFVDCLPADIELRTQKGSVVEFKFQKILTGRYYLTLEKTAKISSAQLDFFVKGKPLKEQFQLSMRLPDKTKTTFKMLRNDRNEILFQMRLADKDNLPVETPDRPEILLEGEGSVEEMRHISEGVWEFKVIYPDENQIMYFSVRAHGVYLSKIFRYQHVEK